MPWSLSKYGRYKRCPAQYDYKYNKNIADPAGAAAQRGTNIHAQIEGFLKTGEWTANISAYAKKMAEKARSEEFIPEVRIALDEQWKPVDWKDPSAWVRGVIDGVKVSADYVTMAEWKSGKIWDDHPLQRNLYLIFGLSVYSAPSARITTVYTDLEHGIEDILNRSDLEKHRAEWKSRITPMLKDTFFSPRPGQHCAWCPFSTRKGGPCSY